MAERTASNRSFEIHPNNNKIAILPARMIAYILFYVFLPPLKGEKYSDLREFSPVK
ncbi:hypothetical protein [Alloprevotella tannerae]|uniref:hypothetical protein n=1 Tax=Alloprevotella tannerae TaxID=76122 RepID=UPI0028D07039|nr:hypothetical protein [Alloprevotella tannerae]